MPASRVVPAVPKGLSFHVLILDLHQGCAPAPAGRLRARASGSGFTLLRCPVRMGPGCCDGAGVREGRWVSSGAAPGLRILGVSAGCRPVHGHRAAGGSRMSDPLAARLLPGRGAGGEPGPAGALPLAKDLSSPCGPRGGSFPAGLGSGWVWVRENRLQGGARPRRPRAPLRTPEGPRRAPAAALPPPAGAAPRKSGASAGGAGRAAQRSAASGPPRPSPGARAARGPGPRGEGARPQPAPGAPPRPGTPTQCLGGASRNRRRRASARPARACTLLAARARAAG